MPLTPDEQAEVLARIERDPIVTVKATLRAAFKRWTNWPFSGTRRRAMFDAWEANEDTQTNRVMSTAGLAVVAPIEALKEDIEGLRLAYARQRKDTKRQSEQMGRLTKQIDDMQVLVDTLYRERALHGRDISRPNEVAAWVDEGLAAREMAVGATTHAAK